MVRTVFRFFGSLGAFGLIGLGILDSSFLFLPFGNDLLLVALTARKPDQFWFYALMAALGSVLGCLLTDIVSRRLGEAGIARMTNPKRLEKVRGKLKTHTLWVLGGAALMPPPFPFTVFLIAASALQISRWRVMTAIGVGRLVRFILIALLAKRFGTYLLRLAERDEVEYAVIALAVISVVGSALSIAKWFGPFKRSEPVPET